MTRLLYESIFKGLSNGPEFHFIDICCHKIPFKSASIDTRGNCGLNILALLSLLITENPKMFTRVWQQLICLAGFLQQAIVIFVLFIEDTLIDRNR